MSLIKKTYLNLRCTQECRELFLFDVLAFNVIGTDCGKDIKGFNGATGIFDWKEKVDDVIGISLFKFVELSSIFALAAAFFSIFSKQWFINLFKLSEARILFCKVLTNGFVILWKFL